MVAENVTPHVNLMFCTPGHSVISDYVKCLLDTGSVLQREGISWGFSNAHSSLVADAREATASGSMANSLDDSRPFQGAMTYDKLMWIDSDITWTPEDVLKLYRSDKDIVSGCYILGNGSVAAFPTFGQKGFDPQEIDSEKELIKIEAAGFGFLCVKQGVFESLSRPWFQQTTYVYQEGDMARTIPVMGEDTSWCKRVTENGYEIWLDPTVRLIHYKTMKLTWNGVQPNVR